MKSKRPIDLPLSQVISVNRSPITNCLNFASYLWHYSIFTYSRHAVVITELISLTESFATVFDNVN